MSVLVNRTAGMRTNRDKTRKYLTGHIPSMETEPGFNSLCINPVMKHMDLKWIGHIISSLPSALCILKFKTPQFLNNGSDQEL